MLLTLFQWLCVLGIFAAALAGGLYPLLRPTKARDIHSLPLGEAFTSGVFLALALTMMLPSAFHVLGTSLPGVNFPVAALIAVFAFLLLLAIEHASHLVERGAAQVDGDQMPAVIPLIMTTLIAIPSFLLGAAFAVSATETAIFIFIAIMMHKSSAAFGLALMMVRSRLKHWQAWMTFLLFALATPLGIVFGADLHQNLGNEAMVLAKGIILALAGGVFLFLSTLHQFQHAAMIRICCTKNGFLFLLAGFAITALVRLIIGEAHQL
ncbi:MAG: ZIP family metal transporter [Pseudomonadota bacterium]